MANNDNHAIETHPMGPDEPLVLDKMSRNEIEVNKSILNDLSLFLFDTNFPFFACFAVIIVLFFIYLKYFKNRKFKTKFKKQNNWKK